ncbi:MAG: hypothetical protein IKH89_05135 [Bacteroidales bacterium]|nr:hypothetical protein [Bacteroidales bacterium]
MKSVFNFRIEVSMSDYHSCRHADFRSKPLLRKVGAMEYRLWDMYYTKEDALKALSSFAAEDNLTLENGTDSYSRDIWTWSIEENTLPESWHSRLDKVDNLEAIAELFNEAEDYCDFDCCKELSFLSKWNDFNVVVDESRPDTFAETETEVLKYSAAANNWYVEDKDDE